ncbi:MAG: hypothetical protein AABZ94_00500 [Candidatus Eisenbacteria bacterium]
MEKSRGTKKTLKTVATMAALVAALATTGCTGSSLMGPESGTQAQGQSVTANNAGNELNPAGNGLKP